MEFNRQNIKSKVGTAETHVIDEGLRAYMLKVYNYMASGVFLTGIVSLILFQLSGGYNIQITSAGGKESHPHDVNITKESPNYRKPL